MGRLRDECLCVSGRDREPVWVLFFLGSEQQEESPRGGCNLEGKRTDRMW